MDMPTNSGSQFEVLRRIILVLLPVIAVVLTFWGDFSALVYISNADFAHEQKQPHIMGIGPLTDEEVRLSELPLDQYIAEVTKGRVIVVRGAAWENLFAKVSNSFASNRPAKGWEYRADGFYYEFHDLTKLYFRPTEKPIEQIVARAKTKDPGYLRLADAKNIYLINIVTPSSPTLGVWPTQYPSALIYPLRKYAWPLAVIGILIYIAVPRPRKNERIVELSRWRLVVMDWLAAVMFIVFFGLPFFITSHSQAAFSDYLVLSAVFWLLALLMLCLVYWSAWYASYRIYVGNGKIRIFNLGRVADFNLWDLEYVQPAALRPPRWLIMGTLLAGAAAANPGAAGQGMILAGSEQNGLYLKARDGRAAYIWFTTQLGVEAMLNFDVLLDELEKANPPRYDEVKEIRAIFPPMQ